MTTSAPTCTINNANGKSTRLKQRQDDTHPPYALTLETPKPPTQAAQPRVQGEHMTTYRDRLNAGEHTDPNFKQNDTQPKKSAAKPATKSASQKS